MAERAVSADALSREAFRTLGEPPLLPLRVLSGFLFGVGPIGILIGAMNLVGWMFDHAFDHASQWPHVNLYDWFSRPEQRLIYWGSTSLLVSAWMVFAVYGRRRAVSTGALQAALSAKPPDRPGGASSCRQCGAPLTVQANAVGVRCAYCQTDNLVSIPAAWVGRTGETTARIVSEVKQALNLDRKERRRHRISLAIALSIFGALTALVVVLLATEVLSDRGDRVFDLRAALAKTPRILFDVMAPPGLGSLPNPVSPGFPARGCNENSYTLPREAITCSGGDCLADWFLPMRAGETLELGASFESTATLYEHVGDVSWERYGGFGPDAFWGTAVATSQRDEHFANHLRAKRTAWHRFRLSMKGVDGDIAICAGILPAGRFGSSAQAKVPEN